MFYMNLAEENHGMRFIFIRRIVNLNVNISEQNGTVSTSADIFPVAGNIHILVTFMSTDPSRSCQTPNDGGHYNTMSSSTRHYHRRVFGQAQYKSSKNGSASINTDDRNANAAPPEARMVRPQTLPSSKRMVRPTFSSRSPSMNTRHTIREHHSSQTAHEYSSSYPSHLLALRSQPASLELPLVAHVEQRSAECNTSLVDEKMALVTYSIRDMVPSALKPEFEPSAKTISAAIKQEIQSCLDEQGRRNAHEMEQLKSDMATGLRIMSKMESSLDEQQKSLAAYQHAIETKQESSSGHRFPLSTGDHVLLSCDNIMNIRIHLTRDATGILVLKHAIQDASSGEWMTLNEMPLPTESMLAEWRACNMVQHAGDALPNSSSNDAHAMSICIGELQGSTVKKSEMTKSSNPKTM